MTRAVRIKVVVAAGLLLAGLLLAAVPKDWMEESFGFEPDGGNGAVELALVVIPLALGLLVAASAYCDHRVIRRRGAASAR